MEYFMTNAVRTGVIIGSIAVFLLCTAFIFGSIVHEIRHRQFGMAFAETCIALLGYAVVIRFIFIDTPVEIAQFMGWLS